jgi:hypothetical protein
MDILPIRYSYTCWGRGSLARSAFGVGTQEQGFAQSGKLRRGIEHSASTEPSMFFFFPSLFSSLWNIVSQDGFVEACSRTLHGVTQRRQGQIVSVRMQTVSFPYSANTHRNPNKLQYTAHISYIVRTTSTVGARLCFKDG